MKLNCVIIEDEPLAMERAKDFISKVPYLCLLETFDNALEAMSVLKSGKVDLLFLDINLGDFSGIQLLETNAVKCKVILTTAYQEFAIKGFELQVSDYLLKPYTLERFIQSVERVHDELNVTAVQTEKAFIFVKTEYRLEKIMLDEILYIEGMRDYRRIHTATKRIMTLQTFTDLEQEIAGSKICRVHKSYMVAVDKIDSIERDRIKMKDVLIPISETYKKAFFEIIGAKQ